MPSRRQVLAGLGAGAAAGTTGCLSSVGLAKTGFCQGKAVLASWRASGRRYTADVYWAWLDSRATTSGRVASDYASIAADYPNAAVSDGVHEALTRRFESVRYVVGFCGDDFDHSADEPYGCLNTGTDRESWNEVQFGDSAEVRVVDHDFRVLSVYHGAHPLEGSDHELRVVDLRDVFGRALPAKTPDD